MMGTINPSGPDGRDGLDAGEQVGGRVAGGEFLIIEADQVGEQVVAEEYPERQPG